jgi:mono/diheme cytochrome c family protein
MKRQQKITGRFAVAAALLLGLGAAQVRAGDAGFSMNGPDTFPQQDGAELFQAICQGCHQSNAQGAIGAAAYPALAQNKKLASAAYPVLTIVRGRKGMPPLASYLSDAQVVAVVTYVRTHFGNHYTDVVSPDMVKSARQSP